MNQARTHAFLREMGLGPLWVPRAAPGPETALTEEERIARLDWKGLRAAIAACTRCGACREGAAKVQGSGAQQAQWLVAAGVPAAADEAAGEALAGEAGRLLDNMLAAVAHARGEDVYVTHAIKCRPLTASGAERAPTAQEAAACKPYIDRELALTGAHTVLTLGQVAANALLERPLAEPLSSVRGEAHALAGGAELVATLHPAELLLRGQDKALAWADLCLARSGDPA